MKNYLKKNKFLGINGIGRIGKLTLWNQLQIGNFGGYVLNTGRKVGKSLDDIVDFLTTDSTYGSINNFFYGYSGKTCNVEITDPQHSIFEINGIPIQILSENRNPKDINWGKYGVQIVAECTGAFTDPTRAANHPKGSLRGHIEAGAEKVIVSAPFKIKDDSLKLPHDARMFVYGINHLKYKDGLHDIISAASCTTTGLAHMIKPLLETNETSKIITASMFTVHAATNNQNILDAVPKEGASDLRRNRSAFNNIIPTSTGAANALEEIIPEIKEIGFMADSVRVPISTSSLITLNLTFKTKLDEVGSPLISQDFLNEIYAKAAKGAQKEMLVFSKKQHVSSDLIGYQAAITIEGIETHTRTGYMPIDIETLKENGIELDHDISIPVTHAKILGWYDNELGSYVNFFCKLINYVDENLV